MTDSNPVSQTTQERDAYWRVLTEIAFGDFEAGPTPDYIREHALRVLKEKCRRIDQAKFVGELIL